MEVTDFYTAVVESSDDAIIAKDVEVMVVAWNPSAERLFGRSAAEMEGQSIRRLLPDDRQATGLGRHHLGGSAGGHRGSRQRFAHLRALRQLSQ